MKESEIIIGNDEICQAIGFVSNKAYVYRVPNTFPYDKETDTGWIELQAQAIGFHTDWNMLVGAYNRIRTILFNMTDLQKELLKHEKSFLVNYAVKNVFAIGINNQLNIASSWVKLVDFAKWYNSIKMLSTTGKP